MDNDKLKVLLIGGAGYVGTALYDTFQKQGITIDICDRGDRGLDHIPVKYPFDSDELSHSTLTQYTHILWLSGCSNVRESLKAPEKAIDENISTITHIAFQLPPTIQFIYASTGSLYTTNRPTFKKSTETEPISPGLNAYDVSKFCFDHIAQSLLPNFVGLRLGTVSGYSRNMRSELIFNAMCLSAINNGVVNIANPNAYRSIVFLDHLIAFIHHLITNPMIRKQIINVASYSDSISNIGHTIAATLDARIEFLPPSITYSFLLDTTKLESIYPAPKTTLETAAEQFQSRLVKCPL